MADETIQFSPKNEIDEAPKKILLEVYNALNEMGYNTVSQIVGHILSEDPTYITTHNNARVLCESWTETSCCRAWLRIISESINKVQL